MKGTCHCHRRRDGGCLALATTMCPYGNLVPSDSQKTDPACPKNLLKKRNPRISEEL
uniref:Uncharacterized protein n=1 Tax=Arundo donax TaxID=35708 RepID=A0A0A9H0X9_ARUDO